MEESTPPKGEPPLFAGKHSGGSDNYPASARHLLSSVSLHRNKDQVLDAKILESSLFINELSLA
jgi:hypothetical protein